MERRNEEWQIQEYRSEGNYEGRVSWILKKGLGLGKKIVLSGIVISSAPLVLSPLLVISAIGFVVSIPSGIFLASYACSEKLMSKLLPILEAEEKIEEEQEEEEHRGVKGKIESVEGDDAVLGDKDVVSVEENGYEEDVEEDLDVAKEKVVVYKEEVPLVDESGEEEPVVVQGVVLDVTAEGGEENGEAAKVEVTTVVVEESGGQERENGVSEEEKKRENGVSEEEMKRETRGSVEEIGDEGKADNVEKTAQESTPTSKEDQLAAATEVLVSHVAKKSKDAGISSEKEVQTSPPSNEAKKKNVEKK